MNTTNNKKFAVATIAPVALIDVETAEGFTPAGFSTRCRRTLTLGTAIDAKDARVISVSIALGETLADYEELAALRKQTGEAATFRAFARTLKVPGDVVAVLAPLAEQKTKVTHANTDKVEWALGRARHFLAASKREHAMSKRAENTVKVDEAKASFAELEANYQTAVRQAQGGANYPVSLNDLLEAIAPKTFAVQALAPVIAGGVDAIDAKNAKVVLDAVKHVEGRWAFVARGR